MGEIFEAYNVLNNTLNLGLKMQDLIRAEGMYKSLLAQRARFPKEMAFNQTKMTEQFEVKAQLVKRKRAINQRTLNTLGARTTTQLNQEYRTLQQNLKLNIRKTMPRRGFKLTPQMQQKQQQQRLR